MCPACQKTKNKKIGNLKGYIQELQYEIYICEACGSKWVDPHQSNDYVYDLIYANKDDVPGYMRYSKYAQEIKHKKRPLKYLAHQESVYYAAIKTVQDCIPTAGRILEVGCGLGYLTYAFAKSGYTVTGLDISQNAITDAEKNYGNHFLCHDFFALNTDKEDEKYDAICMLELIEHVNEPVAYIAHAKNLLKKDGVIIVSTPNKDFYSPETLWASDLPPVHLTWFSEKGVQDMFTAAGCQSNLFSWTKFNFLFGSIIRPTGTIQHNPPFFTKSGTPLFAKFVHSKMYYLTKRFDVYDVVKSIQSFVYKIKEISLVVLRRKSYAANQTGVMCVIGRVNSSI